LLGGIGSTRLCPCASSRGGGKAALGCVFREPALGKAGHGACAWRMRERQSRDPCEVRGKLETKHICMCSVWYQTEWA